MQNNNGTFITLWLAADIMKTETGWENSNFNGIYYFP